jgi:hypothetical protein
VRLEGQGQISARKGLAVLGKEVEWTMGKERYAVVAKNEVEIDGLGSFGSRVQPHLLLFTTRHLVRSYYLLGEAGGVLLRSQV